MRQVALKYLSLTPDEYWRLTPVELGEMMSGAQWRRFQHWEVAAWATAHLINVSGKVSKKQIKPDQLLGKRPKSRAVRSPENDFKELVRRQRVIDAKRAN